MPQNTLFTFFSKRRDCTFIDDAFLCSDPKRGIKSYISKHSDLSWYDISVDTFINCSTLSDGGRECIGSHIRLIERPTARLTERPSFYTQMRTSALWGAGTAVLPEMLGDFLYVKRYINRQTAEKINTLMHTIMLFLLLLFSEAPSENILFFLISAGLYTIFENTLLRYFDFSPSAAEKLAGVLSFALSTTFRNPSSDYILPSAVGYAAGNLSFWVEKKIVEQAPLLLELMLIA